MLKYEILVVEWKRAWVLGQKRFRWGEKKEGKGKRKGAWLKGNNFFFVIEIIGFKLQNLYFKFW